MDNLIHKITVGEWTYFEKTNDISGLKKHGVKRANINKLIEIVRSNLGETKDLNKDVHKLSMKFKIQELETYYSNLSHLMIHQLQVELMLLELDINKDINKDLNNTIKIKVDKLNERFEILIKTPADLQNIKKEITRLKDKYDENFPDKKEETKGLTFPQIVVIVFRVLEYREIDYRMILSDFFGLLEQAKQIK